MSDDNLTVVPAQIPMDQQQRAVFSSPYKQYVDRIGQPFELLGMTDPSTYDSHECGPMYAIRFPDGAEISAWPEEVLEDQADER